MRGKAHLAIGVLSGIQTALLFQIPISLSGIACSAICSLLPDLDEENSTISNYIVNPKASKKIRNFIIILFTTFITMIITQLIPLKNKNILILFPVIIVMIFLCFDKKIKNKHIKKFLLSLVGITIISIVYYLRFHWIFYGIGGLILVVPWFKHRGWTHTIWATGILYLFLRQFDEIFHLQIAIIGTASYASHFILGDIFTVKGVRLFYPIPIVFKIPIMKTGSVSGNRIEWIFIIVYGILLIKQTF